jgi:hypothetical protein
VDLNPDLRTKGVIAEIKLDVEARGWLGVSVLTTTLRNNMAFVRGVTIVEPTTATVAYRLRPPRLHSVKYVCYGD